MKKIWFFYGTIFIINVIAIVCLDLGLTALNNFIRHGTIHYQIQKRSKVRIPSSDFHHTLKPNITTSEVWGPLQYTMVTNSLGFKDKAVRSISPTPAKPRMIFIGDSFTEGVGYSYPDTFVGIVDDALALDGIEVLNAGVQSYSPAIYYAKAKYLLEDLGLQFNAYVVCLDISDPVDEIKNYKRQDGKVILGPEIAGPTARFVDNYTTLLKNVIKEYQRVMARMFDPEYVSGKHIDRTEEDRRYGLQEERSLWTTDTSLFDTFGRRGLALAEDSMNRLYGLLSLHHVELVLVIYPWPDQIFHEDLNSIQVTFWQQWAAARDVQIINLFPAFVKNGRAPLKVISEYYVPGDQHWSKEGHRFVAMRILEELTPVISRLR